jgi:Ca2+-binding EF-hand superfamily protein
MLQKTKVLFAAIVLLSAASCASRRQASEEQNASSAIHRIFLANDGDHNGCLSYDEWHRMVNISLQPLKAEHVDNFNEVRQSYMNVFQETDVDHNGCVTETEYITADEQVRPERRR